MENQIKDNAGAPSVESLVKRGCLFLEDSEWNKADEYFDKALDINPEHAPAYIGKLCAELKVRMEDSLGDYNELRQGKKFDRPLGEYGNFQKALRFADDGYRKKLNDFDQKIKANFPKIPQRFTDEFIKSEIARLEKEIANCSEEIAKGEKEYSRYDSNVKMYIEENKKIFNRYNELYPFPGYDQAYRSELIGKDEEYLRNKKYINDASEDKGKARKYVDEYKNKKTEYEAKKLELEPLVGISCLDRMDYHYSRFVEAMQKESTEEEYKNLAEQFRSLEGYKDSAELADKCGKLVIKKQFEKMVKEKTSANTEEKYRDLSKRFRKMGSYENSAQLAEECDKLADECVKRKEREKKALYDELVKNKSTASSEDSYLDLAQKFRNMGDYENAVQLANECKKQGDILKEQRKEQERQAEKQRKEKEWQEAEAYRRKKEQSENWKRAGRCPLCGGRINKTYIDGTFYNICNSCKNKEYLYSGDSSNNGKATASLVLGIIGLLLSFVFAPPILPIIGIILGAIALGSTKRYMALTGIILSIMGILVFVMKIVNG